MSNTVLMFPGEGPDEAEPDQEAQRQRRRAQLEAIIFSAESPPTCAQLADALGVPEETVQADIKLLLDSYKADARGIEIRPIGGGYRMFTKPAHHDAVRAFAKTLKPRRRLSPAALETLAIVAYRQPVTIPEIQAIRGTTASSGVVHTLLGHKLIATAGRKKVIGRPMRYRTTSDFLIYFGLNDLSELPTLKEIKELEASLEIEDLQVVEESGDEPTSDEGFQGSGG